MHGKTNRARNMAKKIVLSILILIAAYLLYDELSSDNPTTGGDSQGLPSDFLTFYEKFHADTDFQLKRVDFPLPGLPSMISEQDIASDFHWKKENWRPHKLPESKYARHYSIAQDGSIRELIKFPDADIAIERRWQKRQGKWYLVYYAGVNKLMRE